MQLKDVCCFELSAPLGASRGDTEDMDNSSGLGNNYPGFSRLRSGFCVDAEMRVWALHLNEKAQRA